MLVPVKKNCKLGDWGKCKKPCGPEDQTREILIQPENGGTACEEVTKSCNNPECISKF